MSGDNGEMKVTKTDEQLKADKIERFNKNPENFIEVQDIILCCIRNPKSGLGISVFVGSCKRSELDIAQNELNHIAYKRLISMDVESEMKHAVGNGILTQNKGSMFNFARRRK